MHCRHGDWFKPENHYVLRGPVYYYYLNLLCEREWMGTRVCTMKMLKTMSIDKLRQSHQDLGELIMLDGIGVSLVMLTLYVQRWMLMNTKRTIYLSSEIQWNNASRQDLIHLAEIICTNQLWYLSMVHTRTMFKRIKKN